MAKWRIEVMAPAARDVAAEGEIYTIPDPQNWEEFYEHTKLGTKMMEEGRLNEFTRGKHVLQNKGIAIKKGAKATEIVVNDHLLAYLEADRNIMVRTLAPVEEASPAKAIDALPPKSPARKATARKTPAKA